MTQSYGQARLAIRDILYISSDATIAAHLDVPVSFVARARAEFAPKLGRRRAVPITDIGNGRESVLMDADARLATAQLRDRIMALFARTAKARGVSIEQAARYHLAGRG